MKRLACLLTATSLVLAAAAPAKQIVSAQVCGADGCRSIDHPTEQLLMGSPPTNGPAKPSPYVRLQFRMGRGEHARTWFFPQARMTLADDRHTWTRPTALAALLRLAREVRPIPPANLPPGIFTTPEPVSAPLQPRPANGGSDGWWALLFVPIALAAGLWLVRRRGTNDRPEVYGLPGAEHGPRAGGAGEAR